MSLQDTYNSSGLLRSAGGAGLVTLDTSALALASLSSTGRRSSVGGRSVDQVFQGWNKGNIESYQCYLVVLLINLYINEYNK